MALLNELSKGAMAMSITVCCRVHSGPRRPFDAINRMSRRPGDDGYSPSTPHTAASGGTPVSPAMTPGPEVSPRLARSRTG